jgi:hypothetical protein
MICQSGKGQKRGIFTAQAMIIIAPQIAEFTPALFFRMMKLNTRTQNLKWKPYGQ